ncbi:hypothetical protein OEW28_13340 [Defluviimonas sp. WL0002]|uniref:Roadblock/LC7 domain-containing protein n=1 Tax=Albidovulum marisflavi TaxID=2984159 RepID=A0ABT2ZEZ4_9RHOB|nr:hypothetical protein [Defluviimonas sp. WL0002]MCV2869613.1 hypothetical protein [Defluviimonas sp. WL0002]
MSLDKALAEAMNTVPECVAGAYIDIESGLLLSVKTLDSHPQAVLDMVAAATADMFQGPNVSQIEKHFKASRGQKDATSHYFNEFLVFSDNLIHVFLRTKKFPDHVVSFVCRKSANIGMVLAKSRMAIDGLSSAV